MKKADKYEGNGGQGDGRPQEGQGDEGSRPSSTRTRATKFEQAVQLAPTMHEAWNMLGYTRRKLGDYDAALTAYDQALSLKPVLSGSHRVSRRGLPALKRFDDAKQAYLDLFAGNRKLADKLLGAMKTLGRYCSAARGGGCRRRRGLRQVDAGTQPDCGPDRRAHARRRRRELALIADRPCRRAGAGRGGGALRAPASQTAASPYDWHLPRGFPEPAVPADNPMSEAKVALGRRLFFETRLSVTGRLQLRELPRSGARVH